MKDTPLLHTKRLVLRPFSMEDIPAVYGWCSSLETTHYLFWHPHRDIGVTTRLVENWLRKKRNYSWALDDGQGAIGELQLIKDLPDQGFELGYILREESWHQGYMKEALVVVLGYLFIQEDYRYSYEETDERNGASRKLLEAVGYRYVETKPGVYIAKKDETINVAVYRLEKESFLKFMETLPK
jgi:[ribosomal protein S5]-alanine N-acetyltransferase